MRTVAIAVVISMCHIPVAHAGETLREAAVRAADRLVAAEAVAARLKRTERAPTAAVAKPTVASRSRANFQQGPRSLHEDTGMGRGMKLLIGAGIAAVLGGVMLSIDGRVEDPTPSTKGERTNEPF